MALSSGRAGARTIARRARFAAPRRISSRGILEEPCWRSRKCIGTSTTVTRPPQNYGYNVRGATLSLRLPDNRVAVVNCESKYAFRGDYINQRSCRVPPVAEIRAEFKGDNAKLVWPVSLDGRKTQSETYKIVALLSPDGQR